MEQNFCAAVQALTSPTSAPEHRKAAEQWLLQFQQSDEGWPVALRLLASSQPAEVQTFAAQALKRKAWMSRSAGTDVLQHMQRDLVHALAHHPDLSLKPLRQVILALVGATIPLLQNLNEILNQLSQATQSRTTLLFLETLADEVSGLQPYGPGSSDERAQNVADVKACLRSAANSPLGWLARMAAQQHTSLNSSSTNTLTDLSAFDSNTLNLHTSILVCFQAWIRLGTLHDLPMEDGQSLIHLTLIHLDEIDSAAFPAAAEALVDVLEHCPQSWLPSLHNPCMRAAQRAKQAAEAGRPAAAELLCKAVSAYGVLAINIFEPDVSPQSSTSWQALLALALLPHVAEAHGEIGDPVAWPALSAWTHLAECLLDVRVGSFDVFDDEEFFNGANGGHEDLTSGRRSSTSEPGNGHARDEVTPASVSNGASNGVLTPHADARQPQPHDQKNHLPDTAHNGSFASALELQKAQDAAASTTSNESKAIFEKLLCGLLNNLVMWQQPVRNSQASYVDHFSPSFTATLSDCLGCCCAILGAKRFTDLLWWLMDRPDSDPAAPLAAAAAMYAVAAAGNLRLASDGSSLTTLARCMTRAARQPHTQCSAASFLVPFCCAAASTSRMCVCALAQSQGREAATQYLHNALQKALDGLKHPDDSLDVRTPAAMTAKNLTLGAWEANVPLHKNVAEALAVALSQLEDGDVAAEQALVVGLGAALQGLDVEPAGQQTVALETFKLLTGPLHAGLRSALKAVRDDARRGWDEVQGSVKQQVEGPLRRYSLLLQNTAPSQEQSTVNGFSLQGHQQPPTQETNQQQQQQGAHYPTSSSSSEAEQHRRRRRAHLNSQYFTWLGQTFSQQLWPLLRELVLSQDTVTGDFMQHMCRCMTVLAKAQAEQVAGQLQEWLEVLATILFRPKGRHAADTFCALLAYRGGGGVQGATAANAQLAQMAVSAVLSASRATECAETRIADKDPELAEALLKIAGAYMRYVFPSVATGGVSTEQVDGPVAAVSRLCAACACANTRGVAVAALQCVSTVLEIARASSQDPDNPVFTSAVRQAPLLTTCILGGLLSLSPLGRVAKVQQLFIDLGFVSHISMTAQSATQQLQQARQQEPLTAWLAAAANHFRLSTTERDALCSQWTPAIMAVVQTVASGQQQHREAQLAQRHLKKLLRDFAELHSRTQ